jgi:hypothetical protein
MSQCFSWLTTAALVLGTTGLDACGSNKSAPVAAAQTPAPDSQGPGQAASPAQQPAQQNAPADATPATQLPAVSLTADGLDELLAPIALYPDPVLAVMLQAAVDPQEVMDGGNWLAVDNNADLKEAALDQASQKAGFTPVMQALLHYPTVVDLMCTQFDWTKQIGAAYEGNPKAVLESVQRLRAQAVDNGALKTSPQMKVNITQDQGQQVVKLEPGDPKTVYVPSYDPSRVYSTTTTSTSPNGTTTTTTTTSSPAPAATTSSSSSTSVVQEKSGVSTGTAVLIGLLSFGAGIAVGSAISSNNYYYPAWGYGGIWYGPRPYYPPPYYPRYYGGWHGGYNYNRPVHYGNTNIYINNSNNYYNRFNNNNNLNPNYRPKPVPYNNTTGGVYANSMGNRPNTRQQGVTYQPKNNANAAARPATGNIQQRPTAGNAGNNPNVGARPAQGGNNADNWKGQTTYKGKGAANTAQQPVGAGQSRPAPGKANASANNRVSPGNQPSRSPSGDRGFGQPGGTRPATGSEQISRPAGGNAPARPATANQPANRPSTGNQPATRPSTANQPAARPAQQPTSRPENSGGAFGGASNPSSDRAASNRGHNSMGGGGAKPAQTKTAPAGRKK